MSDHWICARLLRRYKRFLADVVLESGEEVTVHCPNTGAMTGCVEEGATVWLSVSDNPKRKYPMTWEIIERSNGDAICVHSARANAVVEEAITKGVIAELQGFSHCQREVKIASGTRADFVLSEPGRCVVEVKSVTLGLGDGYGAFPDAVSDRARRHVEELIAIAAQGDRAVLVLLAMHTGIERLGPADGIDPRYGDTLRRAIAEGVEVLAYGCEVGPEGVRATAALEFLPQLPAAIIERM
ncbi:sugar fermentation stimulation protein A [Litorivivens lipolytica]|uniref:Sugar fermentation stimulation protein homolog n=1 Tax=Litorivivens lipolytica TaxID=1524264 RepID=A0A7W4Z650_9GAMM|nr:DNA/RNA nuclease SfsA [Litorivivens lipolytica]MBB3047883.1 sugar fermentation stimulation protein A [Litorivivens lipolytica]